MSNPYYVSSGIPSTSAALSSSAVRGEFSLVEDGFDLLPTVSGNANKLVLVNSGGTGLTASAEAYNLTTLVIGHTAKVATQNNAGGSVTPVHQQHHQSGQNAFTQLLASWSSTASHGGELIMAHSKSAAIGSHTATVAEDKLGQLTGVGSDGTEFVRSAGLEFLVSGAVSAGVVPGKAQIKTMSLAAAYPVRMTWDHLGNCILGTAAIATSATDGFLYITSCAGSPSGTPTTQTGRVAMVADTVNNRLYVNVAGTWRYAALT